MATGEFVISIDHGLQRHSRHAEDFDRLLMAAGASETAHSAIASRQQESPWATHSKVPGKPASAV